MATLEKIRKKSVLLLVIIGAALIAFIIGDFLNSGSAFFGDGTTVAKVDGKSIDYMQFQQRYAQMAENNQQASQADPAVMQNSVLNQMISEILLDEEYEALGISVSDKELSEFMFKNLIMDQNFGQQISYIAQALQAPVEMNPAKPDQFVRDFHAFIFNPAKFGRQEDEAIAQAKAWWIGMEQSAEAQLKQMKLFRLMGGTIVANDLDRAAIKENLSNSYEVQMVSVPYGSLDNKKYEVSEADLKAAYEKEKSTFALKEEMRRVHYIVVPIAPSADDNAKADALMAKVDSAIKANPGIEGARQFSELSISEAELRLSDMNRDAIMKGFFENAEVGQISAISRQGDNRVIYRLLDKTIQTDSVSLEMVQVLGDKKFQETALADLNSGKEVANDSTIVKGEAPQTIDLVAALAQGAITPEIRNSILNAESGKYFVLNNANEGAVLAKVTDKKAAKTIYKTATVTYTLTASKETRGFLQNELQKYIDTNNTAKAFSENATKSEQHYFAQTAILSADSPALGTQYSPVKGTAKLVQWVFNDAEEGAVSAIQVDNDKLVVCALDNIYDGEYMPLSDQDVKMFCENVARNDKKAEDLMKQYAGKATDLAGYAKLMGKEVETRRVGGGTPTIEPTLGAQVPYSALNKTYGPVKGQYSVFVYNVIKKEPAANTPTDAQIDGNFAQQFMMFNNLVEVIKNNKEIENRLVNFR